MDALLQILSPGFLLRNSIYASMLIGFACPIVGVFLVMRRLVFMGVALPQISSTGIAVALSLPLWLGFHVANQGSLSPHALAFAGATTFSLGAIMVLAFLERRGKGQPEGRIGTAYVTAAALSILILSKNPYGEIGWLGLLKGEVVTISNLDLVVTAAALALVLIGLAVCRKELLLVCFDREMAITLRKNVIFWDILLYLMIGLTVSTAVLSVGPLITFGFLLLPALTAHLLARTMKQLTILASLIGGGAAFLGFWIAYKWDLPVGPTDVCLLSSLYGTVWLLTRLLSSRTKRFNGT
ncbi:MAG: metal ABC transporter permease [Syntrophobacterales bacterium]|jgi:ABC-type Mn2+/Zn2+ transport system permease subunit|nr:metal ABC transporter permease [Syntrophobacterales bacterium]